MNVYQSLKENLSKITFLGRKETSVTAAIIIAKSFKLKHARILMEEHFILLVEEKSAYVSQGKQKTGKSKYTSLRKVYGIISSGGIFPKYNYMFHIDTIKVV